MRTSCCFLQYSAKKQNSVKETSWWKLLLSSACDMSFLSKNLCPISIITWVENWKHLQIYFLLGWNCPYNNDLGIHILTAIHWNNNLAALHRWASQNLTALRCFTTGMESYVFNMIAYTYTHRSSRRFHKTLPNLHDLRLIIGLRTSPNPAL